MKYMLAIFADYDHRADEDFSGAWRAYERALREAGVYVDGNGLRHPSTATTVRLQDGERRVQDGPFADSKEQLGGYIILELASLDEALDWAARCPAAGYGAVEVRPVWSEWLGSREETLMKYVLLVYETDSAFEARSSEADSEFWGAWRAYHQALVDAGVYVGGSPLEPPATATMVRMEAGERRVQDGPCADTKEQVGGFILLEAPSLDQALARPGTGMGGPLPRGRLRRDRGPAGGRPRGRANGAGPMTRVPVADRQWFHG